MGIYQIFVYLQLLDLLTTMVGFRLGAVEASPFINKAHIIRWISYWYAGLIVWNLMIMLASKA